MSLTRVGVFIEEKAVRALWEGGHNVFQLYIREVFEHLGIPFLTVHHCADKILNDLDILIVAVASEEEETEEAIWNFAEKGGTVIAYGGLAGLKDRIGCEESGETGAGYAKLAPLFNKQHAMRYLQASPWKIKSDYAGAVTGVGSLHIGGPNGEHSGAALIHAQVGSGRIDRWAVDPITMIVQFQQGSKPVIADGIPAEDGSASVNDGILKADDVYEMDWSNDRLQTETGAPYFAYPYADLWREVIISHLLQRAVEQGGVLPFMDYWPEGIPSVALISHDSDENMDDHAITALSVLEELGITSTWCMMEPGYSQAVYEKVKADGHELAFHYNSLDLDNGVWSKEEFRRQISWLHQSISSTDVASNKNHYTRIEGWGELFSWCEEFGIASDQTRGPSKRGNIGFLFGTCHPYFPIAWVDEQNRLYDVVEISFLTQDLEEPSLADSSVIIPFLDQVALVKGVAHFLFHQRHIHHSEEVRSALRKVVTEARKRGFAFWTGDEIQQWERYKRKLVLKALNTNIFEVCYEIQTDDLKSNFEPVVWLPIPHGDCTTYPDAEIRFGVKCKKAIFRQETTLPTIL
ncbi:hypothetical protein [Paenibacillus sp. PAMC21692]|uniref:hypothetical protein n=1 Tax=Paenibacillus sp. PAMC21692 TaxID=2762320 RepID=UPI00164E19B4|nr:hypothetical protein [Paenibacillus sp. PAMC21692]QNK56294.1 hypothetical protein H7F31_27695 [Paenibacillus sp. PAMC21692]